MDGWDFEMHRHIRLSVLYKYGQLDSGKTDDKPVENIILPILNVAYRLEDIDVKDINPYVNEAKNFWKSFFVKKFHDKWARKFEIDTFIDEAKISRIDFGLTLVKNFDNKQPECVPLQRLAFCDQTDVLSGPICEKHLYSPDQLQEMAGKWDKDKIEEVIVLSRAEKANSQVSGQKAKTPGKYIEVYELHGVFPEDWLEDDGDPDKYVRQVHIIVFATKKARDNKQGTILFRGKEKVSIYDACKRDNLYGRACGYGGCEELFEPQVWNTYSRIQMKEMLDIASAMILKTTAQSLKNRKTTDLEKGEILSIEDGEDISQVVITPINWQVFDKWQADMRTAAQTMGSANDPQLGVQPASGTAMGLQKVVIAQGQGIHEYRRGTFATFLARLYKNWFLDFLVNEMNKGDEWLNELTLKEIQWVAEQISDNEGNKETIRRVFAGEDITKEAIEAFKEDFKKDFKKGGLKKFIKLIKNEFKNIPVDVDVNIAGKQKYLANLTEKIVSFMKAIVATPQILTIPGMADLLNQVIEFSGLNPVDFSGLAEQLAPPQQQQIPQQAIQQPQQVPQMV